MAHPGLLGSVARSCAARSAALAIWRPRAASASPPCKPALTRLQHEGSRALDQTRALPNQTRALPNQIRALPQQARALPTARRARPPPRDAHTPRTNPNEPHCYPSPAPLPPLGISGAALHWLGDLDLAEVEYDQTRALIDQTRALPDQTRALVDQTRCFPPPGAALHGLGNLELAEAEYEHAVELEQAIGTTRLLDY